MNFPMPPIAVPCRVCLAGPGADCAFAEDPMAGTAPPKALDQPRFHPTRESDAALTVSVLVDLARKDAEERARRAASPAVIVRPASDV